MTAEKKKKERWFLNRWLATRETTATSIICYERPDFLVTLGNRLWGVEITTYNRSPSEREASARWRRIHQIVEQRAQRGDLLEHLAVHIKFREMPILRHSETFVSTMFDFIRHLAVEESILCCQSPHLPASLSKYVERLRLRKVRQRYSAWTSAHQYFSPVGTNNDELVQRFQRKLEVIYEHADVYKFALVIGGDTFDAVSFMSPTLSTQIPHFEEFNEIIFSSIFDEVLILDYYDHRWRRGEGWTQV